MTNIVDFEEKLNSGESLTDNILDGINRINEAKFSGVLSEDELAKNIMMQSKLFANQVKMRKKSEEDVTSFEAQLPSNSNCFSFKHKHLEEASSYSKEINTDALLQRETWDKQAQPIKGYSRGLNRTA